jgi:nucleolar protein 58
VKLKAFSKFENNTEALAAAAAMVDSKLSKGTQETEGISNAASTVLLEDHGLGSAAATVTE